MGLSCSTEKAKKDNQMKRQNLEKDKKGKQNQEKHEIKKRVRRSNEISSRSR